MRRILNRVFNNKSRSAETYLPAESATLAACSGGFATRDPGRVKIGAATRHPMTRAAATRDPGRVKIGAANRRLRSTRR